MCQGGARGVEGDSRTKIVDVTPYLVSEQCRSSVGAVYTIVDTHGPATLRTAAVLTEIVVCLDSTFILDAMSRSKVGGGAEGSFSKG
jgi:hypothetical protein